MPNYKDHLSGGSIAFAIALLIVVPHYNTSVLTAAEWYICSLAGSLFPDIDIKSKGQRYFYWLTFLLIILLSITKRFFALSIISILAIIPLLGKHRGLFHRTWFIIGAPMLAWYIVALNYPLFSDALFFDMLFFTIGALSHLYLDLGLKKMLRI